MDHKRITKKNLLVAQMPRYRHMTDGDLDNAVATMVLFSTLCERHDALIGTRFYSSRLNKALDEYNQRVLLSLFKGDGADKALDQVGDIINVHARLIGIMLALKSQPDSVQEDFNEGLVALARAAGVPDSVMQEN